MILDRWWYTLSLTLVDSQFGFIATTLLKAEAAAQYSSTHAIITNIASNSIILPKLDNKSNFSYPGIVFVILQNISIKILTPVFGIQNVPFLLITRQSLQH